MPAFTGTTQANGICPSKAVGAVGRDPSERATGVTTSPGTTTLTYDYDSRITGITYPSTATNSFTYNGLDTRVSKTDSAGMKTYRRVSRGKL